MRFSLRALPLRFKGELFDIKLVQFSLDVEEAQEHLPAGFAPFVAGGRAIFSLANVQIHRMRLTGMPRFSGFNYRHVAFRFLIDDKAFDPASRGPAIFFVKSFTDRPWLARAADWLTYYRVAPAHIESSPTSMSLEQANHRIEYRLSDQDAEPKMPGAALSNWDEAAAIVKALDRAYGLTPDGSAVITRVLRPGWPVEPVEVTAFSTNFFQSARLECGFRIREPVPYIWQAPRTIRT